MRLNVVNIRCPNTLAQPCAFPAPGLPDELVGAAFLPAIAWIRVQVVPGCRFLPVGRGFVSGAIAFACEHPAARVAASSQGFLHFGHLQGKTKSLCHVSLLRYMAQALRHRHNGNIQDGLCAAALALDRHVSDHRSRKQVGHRTSSAHRTWYRFSCCVYFITRRRIMQDPFGLPRESLFYCVQ